MTRRVMDNLYRELNKIGMHFEECDFRHTGTPFKMKDDYVCYGILSQNDGASAAIWNIEAVVNVARRKKVAVIIAPREKEVKKRRNASYETIQLKKTELVVFFVQLDLFQTLHDASKKISVALRQSFLYLQEDEKILELHGAIARLIGALDKFEQQSAFSALLVSNSYEIRQFMQKDGEVFSRKEMRASMDDIDAWKQTKILAVAAETLGLIGK